MTMGAWDAYLAFSCLGLLFTSVSMMQWERWKFDSERFKLEKWSMDFRDKMFAIRYKRFEKQSNNTFGGFKK